MTDPDLDVKAYLAAINARVQDELTFGELRLIISGTNVKIALAAAHRSMFNDGLERGYTCGLKTIAMNRTKKACINHLKSVLRLKCSHHEKQCAFCRGARMAIGEMIDDLIAIQ